MALPLLSGLPCCAHISRGGAPKHGEACSSPSGGSLSLAHVSSADTRIFRVFVGPWACSSQVSFALFRSTAAFPETSVHHVNERARFLSVSLFGESGSQCQDDMYFASFLYNLL